VNPVLVWSAILAGVLTGWALRARHLRRRTLLRESGLLDDVTNWRTEAHWAQRRRDTARAERDHAVWEHGQERRLRLAAERDAGQWRDIARAWMERAVDHLARATAAETDLAEARREIAAYAATDEAVGELLRQMGPAPAEPVREEAS
jgi:CRP-like cAMP-binding protein